MNKKHKLLLASVFLGLGLMSGQASAAWVDTALADMTDKAILQVADIDSKALAWDTKFAVAAAVVAGGGFIIRRVIRA